MFSSGLAVSNDKMCFPAYNAGIEGKVSLHMYSELRGYKQLPILQTVELPGIKNFWGIHMTSSSELLTTDDKEGALYKYDIPGGKLMWKTEGLDSPADITSDSFTGMIYVASQQSKKVYVFNSITGELYALPFNDLP